MLQHKQLVENEYKQLVQYAIYTAAALCSMWHAAAKQVEQYISAAQAIGAAQAIYISGCKQLDQYISAAQAIYISQATGAIYIWAGIAGS